MLTKDDAEKIAVKLKGDRHSGSKHELVRLVYEGKLIAQFGIRRGSRKDQGHDFIPRRDSSEYARYHFLGTMYLFL